ncbi:MAG TPA: DUF3826 domain-containing protein [Verrucomicrobiota bacterium]|nr:DUF3826 domain-containing protein [Verrucomicrobiota bacterium]
MNQTRLITVISTFALAAFASGQLHAVDGDAVRPAVAIDEATQKRIDGKAGRLLDALKLSDADKAARVKGIIGEWFVTMWNWHKENDPKLTELWSEWSKARAVVPKDEYPGEVIAHKIDDVYASLKPAYKAFLDKLATELTQEQIDAIKETWSRSPGMTRTYNAYLEIVPDLTDEQKKVIYDRMLIAREDAMLTDSDREIVNIYKRHKVKVEAYVGTLEWAKLHKAFANRGKAQSSAAPAAGK